MTILLTGATGYLGAAIARKIVRKGDTLHVLARDPSRINEKDLPNCRIFKGDINDPATIASAIKGCEGVFHCAAYARLWAKDPNIFYTINVKGTGNMLEQAFQHGVQKFVYTSSTAIWGPNPFKIITEEDPRLYAFDNDYDLSKHLAEQMVREYGEKGMHTVIVNPSRIFGPGQLSYSNAFTRLLIRALSGKTVIVPGARRVLANYAFIEDVAEGHLMAMEYGRKNENYILGGENISYNKLIKTAIGKIGKVKILRMPVTVMKLAGWLQLFRFKLFGTEPAFTPGMLKRFFTNMAFSSKKAEKQLGYQITPFEESLEKTIEHLKNHSHG